MAVSTEALSWPRSARAAAAGPQWRESSLFMLRVAGLPIESLDALRVPAACRWADEVSAEEERLTTRGGQLSDLLHDVISTEPAGPRRQELVRIRREVFNNRLPREPAAFAALAGTLGGPAGRALTEWLRDRLRLDQLLPVGETVLAGDMAKARAALRRLAAEPRLRQGLLLASPTLEEHLASYAEGGTGKLTKRQRRIERSLLEYVYRTACKTSPFSSFTGVTLGQFSDSPGEDLFSVAIEDGWTSRARLNVAILSRIAEVVMANDSLRVDLPMTLVSGWRQDLERIRFIRRTVTAGNDANTVGFDFVQENMFFLHHSGALDRVVELMGASRLRYGEIVSELAAAGDADASDYDRYLRVLIRLGLLQAPDLAVDLHSPDPVRSFRAAVTGVGTAWATELAGRLERPIELVDAYPGATLADRRELLSELRGELNELLSALGAPDATLPQSIVYEDCRTGGSPARCERRGWAESIGRALRTLTRMAPAFDEMLPHKLTLKRFFLARWGPGGRCDDLLGLIHDFAEDIYGEYSRVSLKRRPFTADGSYVPLDNWLNAPEIVAIDRAREEFARRMRELSAAGPDGDLVLDDDVIAAVAAELPASFSSYRPQAHFLQLANCDGKPLGVLNQWFCGVSFPFTRFLHCFDDFGDEGLTGTIRTALRAAQPTGSVFAELTGGFNTTNLNLHGRLTDFVLVCPGETSTAPQAELIPLEDLYVVHDPEADRLVLRSARAGREIIPLYLGYLMPAALPEVPRILTLFSPASKVGLDPWEGVPDRPGHDGIARRPRVTCGDLVLSRRSWATEPDRLPLRRPESGDSEWFLGWRRWRRGHGLPAQVFVTLESADGDGEPAAPWLSRRKPHFVDLDSFLSLSLLEAMLKPEISRVVFREMLPAEDQLYAQSPGGRHVTELAVESISQDWPGPEECR